MSHNERHIKGGDKGQQTYINEFGRSTCDVKAHVSTKELNGTGKKGGLDI
jgi:hypothetical protein